ncbi:MAG: hypothetical protein HQL30_08710 [Candidatus Omnitrophica bacterium]|nr:hypothetical protein [Candidatus Omnitrophota bacterium]
MRWCVPLMVFLFLMATSTRSGDIWLDAPTANPGKDRVIVSSKTVDKRVTGLRINKPEKTFKGYTLLVPLLSQPSFTGGLSPVDLVDMDGLTIHRWLVADPPPSLGRLSDNGTLFLATQMSGMESPGQMSGLKELDAESNELFLSPGVFENEFYLIDNDTFVVTYKDTIPTPPGSPFPLGSMSAPRIDIITKDGRTLWQWKGEDHLKELVSLSGFHDVFTVFRESQWQESASGDFANGLYYEGEDWAHNNTAMILGPNPLEANDPRFKSGNILFCFCGVDTIGIIEYPSGRIIWAWGPGELENPHTPRMIDNGNILIFDNGAKRKWSRVIEIDPVAGNIVWEYHSWPKNDFFSVNLCNAERLPNGNTLICEGLSERVFEVTPKGEIVWDYISTYARLMGGLGMKRAFRYPPGYVAPLLEAKGHDPKAIR